MDTLWTHREFVLILDATVLFDGIVQAATVRYVGDVRAIEAVVSAEDSPGFEDASGGVDEGAGMG